MIFYRIKPSSTQQKGIYGPTIHAHLACTIDAYPPTFTSLAPTSLLTIIKHTLKNFVANRVINFPQIAVNPFGAISSVTWTDTILKEKLQHTLIF